MSAMGRKQTEAANVRNGWKADISGCRYIMKDTASTKTKIHIMTKNADFQTPACRLTIE